MLRWWRHDPREDSPGEDNFLSILNPGGVLRSMHSSSLQGEPSRNVASPPAPRSSPLRF